VKKKNIKKNTNYIARIQLKNKSHLWSLRFPFIWIKETKRKLSGVILFCKK
jgi:hypothetical protein